MKKVGTCPREAIDWAQDYLRTTRPLAERVVFRLMERQALIVEGEHYVFREDETKLKTELVRVLEDQKKNRRGVRIERLTPHTGQNMWDPGSTLSTGRGRGRQPDDDVDDGNDP